MQHTLSVILLLSLFVLACQPKANNTKEPIARVGDAYLYPEKPGFGELKTGDIPWNKEQIETWVNRQIWVQEAEKFPLEADLEELVLDYKQSLLIDGYKANVLSQANIQVTQEEILNYYKENQADFILENELYKLQYYLLDADMDENSLLKDLNSNSSNANLKQFCLNHPNKCLVEALWVERGVLETLEFPTYMWNTTVKFQRFYYSDGAKGLFRIEGKKIVGDAEPLELVSNEIRAILQFQKEKEIIKKHEEKLLLNAQNENSIEIY